MLLLSLHPHFHVCGLRCYVMIPIQPSFGGNQLTAWVGSILCSHSCIFVLRSMVFHLVHYYFGYEYISLRDCESFEYCWKTANHKDYESQFATSRCQECYFDGLRGYYRFSSINFKIHGDFWFHDSFSFGFCIYSLI